MPGTCFLYILDFWRYTGLYKFWEASCVGLKHMESDVLCADLLYTLCKKQIKTNAYMHEEKFRGDKIVLHTFLDAFRYFCFEFLYFCDISSLSSSKWRNFNSASLVSNLDKIQIATRFILTMSISTRMSLLLCAFLTIRCMSRLFWKWCRCPLFLVSRY